LQKLLRHPSRAQLPAAEPAVGDFDGGGGGHEPKACCWVLRYTFRAVG
jgi:dihydroxyacetone kinase